MTETATEFEQLESSLAEGGLGALLDRLADSLKQRNQYEQLYEARKMQVRHRLGLPPLTGLSASELPPDVRDKLEDGLIGACREVGMTLLANGRIADAWNYLRAVDDRSEVAAELQKIEPDEDNIDELIDVSLYQGVAPQFGFKLVLEHHGTCNSITNFESVVQQCDREDQQGAAVLLVKHVHEELLATVKSDIASQEGSEPASESLAELVADRDWLFGDSSYHIDTTHLSSTVRFARILEDEAALRLAVDLTEYGRRLSSQFQYQGDEPFADHYPAHAIYLRALLGEDVDAAVNYFADKAEQVNQDEFGTIAIEVYIDFLARLKRYEEAIDATLELAGDEEVQLRFAPSLWELSQKANSFDKMIAHYRNREDLLGFAAGLVCSQSDVDTV